MVSSNEISYDDSYEAWRSMFDLWWKRFNEVQLMEFLPCGDLGSLHNIHHYLNATANISKICSFGQPRCDILDREHANRFLALAKHANNSIILKYIHENYEKIKPR